jgi:hypothetical protein
MNFLNLGLSELLGLVSAVSAGVVALYLLDRSKRRHLVATLRFWTPADVRTELKHRRRIQQPWSLVLQLASLALLLTAIAGPQFGVFDGAGEDHVVILDTSAWMGSLADQGTLMDQAKANARAYLRALPRRDRVMLVRAGAVATPATAFESNRAAVEEAIQQSLAGASALNLAQALEFGRRALELESRHPGEIVFVGAARVAAADAGLASVPERFRMIAVDSRNDNVGLRKLATRRSPASPDSWDIFVAVRNYGARPQTVDLAVQFAMSPAGSRRMTLRPGAEEQATFTYREKAGGWVEARLNVRDAFPQDDRAVVELPPQASVKVRVYTTEPALLRPLFASNPLVQAEFVPPASYDAAAEADVVVLDRFAPPAPLRAHSIWIEPPAAQSPVPVRTTAKNAALERWSADSTLGAGLYTRDVTLDSAEVFSPAPGDVPVAEAGGGPVIVARGGTLKQVFMGFHPGRGSMRYELATPLLIANTLRWMAPGAYRRYELEAGTVGTVTVPVEKNTDPAQIAITDEADRKLPFTLQDGTLRFFAGAPGTVRVAVGDREMVYSLTLPDVAETEWKAPATALKGVPRAARAGAAPTDVWPWLAVLGGIGLLADWILFGRSRIFRLRPARTAAPAGMWRKAS